MTRYAEPMIISSTGEFDAFLTVYNYWSNVTRYGDRTIESNRPGPNLRAC